MKQPKFVSGPPGTGKTHIYLIDKYKKLLKSYNPEKIVMLSHTNVAADELINFLNFLAMLLDKEEQLKSIGIL